GLADEVDRPGRYRAAEWRDLPGAGGAARVVLHRPAVEADGRGAAIAQLDEVVLVRRAGVASTAVDLVDDDVRGRRRRSGRGAQQDRARERERRERQGNAPPRGV